MMPGWFCFALGGLPLAFRLWRSDARLLRLYRRVCSGDLNSLVFKFYGYVVIIICTLNFNCNFVLNYFTYILRFTFSNVRLVYVCDLMRLASISVFLAVQGFEAILRMPL